MQLSFAGVTMLAECLERFQIREWGVCPLSRLELMPVGSRRRIPKEAKSVIAMLFGYYIGEYPRRNIARYALADDYHGILGEILRELCGELEKCFPGESFAPFADASPIPEVEAAVLCGLGTRGKNGLLLSPVYGSYCFIGEIVSSLAAEAAPKKAPALCTGCGACIAACPTGALSREGFCRERCLSHITQKKAPLTPWEEEQLQKGGFIWGCDRCTDSCPVNKRAAKSGVAAFYKDVVPWVSEGDVGELSKKKAYGWRGEGVLLRNLALLKRRNPPPEGEGGFSTLCPDDV